MIAIPSLVAPPPPVAGAMGTIAPPRSQSVATSPPSDVSSDGGQLSVTLYLVCPHCEADVPFRLTHPKSAQEVACPACRKGFEVLIVKIRAKRSRGNRKGGSREFDVRVIEFSGQERLLQFENAEYDDFELRQGDDAVFYYTNGELRLVQNLTIREVYEVSSSSCYLATFVFGSGSEEVALLRQFRDEVLLPRRVLAGMVRLYYRASPRMVRLFGGSRLCKVVVAAALTPLLWFVRRRCRSRVLVSRPGR
jgi:hypothetical protein